jgi:hypothetical protein
VKKIALTMTALFIGCRGLLDIEPIDLDTPSEAGTDARSDTGSTADAGSDAASPYAACAAQGVDCFRCCHTSFGREFDRLPTIARQVGCICGAGACSGSDGCLQQTCADPPQPPREPCGPCIDRTLTAQPLSPQCGQAASQCASDPTCEKAIGCLRACAP